MFLLFCRVVVALSAVTFLCEEYSNFQLKHAESILACVLTSMAKYLNSPKCRTMLYPAND